METSTSRTGASRWTAFFALATVLSLGVAAGSIAALVLLAVSLVICVVLGAVLAAMVAIGTVAVVVGLALVAAAAIVVGAFALVVVVPAALGLALSGLATLARRGLARRPAQSLEVVTAEA